MKATCSADALDVRIFAIGCLKPKSREMLISNPPSSSPKLPPVELRSSARLFHLRPRSVENWTVANESNGFPWLDIWQIQN